jgi:pyruvate/2-oxoglutarate dehydrogenase complex dihydrolipoamide acyltransferase (E2) component
MTGTAIALAGARAIIAQRMHASLQETAQLSFLARCDATALVGARRAWRDAGMAVSYEDLVAESLARVLPEHPLLNAVETPAGLELIPALHLSFAVDLPGGLVAPTVFDAQDMTVDALSAARRDLIARAREGKLTIRQLTGGTFTLSNLGGTRIEYFTPVLNRPQAAIVGIGRIADTPWVDAGGALVVKQVLSLSLTADHRFVDGLPAGRFLSALCEHLESAVAHP